MQWGQWWSQPSQHQCQRESLSCLLIEPFKPDQLTLAVPQPKERQPSSTRAEQGLLYGPIVSDDRPVKQCHQSTILIDRDYHIVVTQESSTLFKQKSSQTKNHNQLIRVSYRLPCCWHYLMPGNVAANY